MGHLSASYLVATFFNNFLPSNVGGDVIRVRDGSRLTGSTTASVAMVAIDRIRGLGALYLLAVVAYVFGGTTVRGLAGALPALVALGVVFGVVGYVYVTPGITRKVMSISRLDAFPWIRERFEVAQDAVHVYREQVAAVWMAFAASVALQALVVCYYYEVARSLRVPLPLSACFLVVPLCTLVQTVPVSFNALKRPEPASRLLEEQGIPVRHLGRGRFDPRILGDLVRLAREGGAAILHVHGYAAADFGRLAARRVGAALVLHEHFADPRMPSYQAVADRALARLTDRAIAVSESTRDFLVRQRHVPASRVRVIWNGAPLDEFAPVATEKAAAVRRELGLPTDSLVIRSIGRFNEQKGYRYPHH